MASSKLALKAELKAADSLAQEAYDWLVTAITTFKIPTNSQISENKLATELGFSRTPVREALMLDVVYRLLDRLWLTGRFTDFNLNRCDFEFRNFRMRVRCRSRQAVDWRLNEMERDKHDAFLHSLSHKRINFDAATTSRDF